MDMNRLSAQVGRIGTVLALSLASGFVLAADAPTGKATASAKAAAKRVYFASPEAGFEALVAALRKPDFKAVDRLLGPGHQRITDSGDSVADREAAKRFVAAYDLKHGIELQGDATAHEPDAVHRVDDGLGLRLENVALEVADHGLPSSTTWAPRPRVAGGLTRRTPPGLRPR